MRGICAVFLMSDEMQAISIDSIRVHVLGNRLVVWSDFTRRGSDVKLRVLAGRSQNPGISSTEYLHIKKAWDKYSNHSELAFIEI